MLMATLAEYEEAILNQSDIGHFVDTSELIDILSEYAKYTGEQWHGENCECPKCAIQED